MASSRNSPKSGVKALSPAEELVAAAMNGDIAFMREQLDRGSDVDTRGKGATLLMWAIICNKNDIARLLIERGADVNKKDEEDRRDEYISYTALMYAAREGNEEIVRLLIDKGASLHVKSSKGKTAADVARFNNELEIARMIEDAIAEKAAARVRAFHAAVTLQRDLPRRKSPFRIPKQGKR